MDYEQKYYELLDKYEQLNGRYCEARDLFESATARNCETIHNQRLEIERLKLRVADYYGVMV